MPKQELDKKRRFYESYVYNIFEASAESGYVLIKKHKFGADRYDGYEHCMTNTKGSAEVAIESREYVFEKTDKTYVQIKQEQNPSMYIALREKHYSLPIISTDDE